MRKKPDREQSEVLHGKGVHMIKAVIFDIDNTLYSYEHSHEYGMRSLAAYCNRVFGVSEEETEECYKRANKIMMGQNWQ